MGTVLKIQRGNTIYEPVVVGEITLTREKDSVSSLEFRVLSDKDNLELSEGSKVTFVSDEIEPKGIINNLFLGYIFRISPSKDGYSDVTAYDQIRYLKNTDTYTYENKTMTQLLRMIANDCKLNAGPDIMETGYSIPSRIEEQKSYLDMLMSAKKLTIENTGNEFFLWDNFGEMALHDTEFLKIGLEINNQTAEDFNFETEIDSDTYNRIKLFRELDDGTREVFVKENTGTQGQWGLLQYSDTLTDEENGDNKAEILLTQKNRKKVSLSISGAFGDARVRGGTSLKVKLDTFANMGFSYGGMTFWGFLQVSKVVHHFKGGYHNMDLTLYGSGFIDGE
jgi:hypothetical protein